MSIPALFVPPLAPMPMVASLIAILGLVALHKLVLRPFFFSPLRHVPGPKTTDITSLYLNRLYYNDNAVEWIKSLHDKYGPIVRVGPQEVVVNDPKQLSAIYGVRSIFSKPPTAVLNQNYGSPNAFSSITREEHRQNRKQVAKVYTMNTTLNNSSLLEWIRNRLVVLQNIIERNPKVDIYALTGYFAADIVSYQVLGRSLDLLGGKNLEMAQSIRDIASASVQFVRFSWLFTALSVWPLSYLLPESQKKLFKGVGLIEAKVQEEITSIKTRDQAPDPETAAGYMQTQPTYGKTLTEGQVMSECVDHVMAGADTTAASMTYMLYTLARPENRHYQAKLRAEVSSLPALLDFKAVCQLPYLNICVLESMRLHAPGPGSLQQRVTPANEDTTLVINGKAVTLPPGTMIGTQAYSLHRNEAVFGARTNEFLPERWEDADEEQLQAMKDSWITFGTGARICLGINLALLEVKIMIVTLLRAYTIELPEDFDHEWMEPIYAAVIRPKAEKCPLVFRTISTK